MSTEVAKREQSAVTTMAERLASNPDVDVAKLEKLLEMQERIMAREAEAAFNAAFAELQAELPEISEKGEIKHNGKLISTFAYFEDINESIKPILQKHGFGVSFRVDIRNDQTIVTGILMHREGHREQTSMALPADNSGAKNAVQAIGSSTSYGKRYVLCALLNISTRGEDDDGQAAEAISPEQAAQIKKLLEETGSNVKAFLGFAKASSVDAIRATDYQRCMAMLEKKRKAK